MTDDTPDIRRDAKYYGRHLVAFYAGLTPVFIALLYAVFYVQSFVWFFVVSLAGVFATFAVTMCILPYPICASCGKTVRQRRLDIHAETGKRSYCCSACNIRWIVEPNSLGNGVGTACGSAGTRSSQTGR